MKTPKLQSPPIRFKATIEKVGDWSIIELPTEASLQLPSRGLVMVEGTIDGRPFQSPLEPDGKKGHWLRVEKSMTDATVGDSVSLEIRPSSEWPEPSIPDDLQAALSHAPPEYAVWKASTTIARWDWIRWIRATNNPETRKKRIEVALSKMRGGSRRPCCFDRASCTQPDVSKSGVLLTRI